MSAWLVQQGLAGKREAGCTQPGFHWWWAWCVAAAVLC